MNSIFKTALLCCLFVLLQVTLFAHTEQPKSLYFKVDLQNNVTHFGHFETKKHHFQAIKSKTLSNFDENDVMQIIQSELGSAVQNPKVLVFIHGMWGNREVVVRKSVRHFEKEYGTENDLVIHIIWEAHRMNVGKCQRNARNSTPFVTSILRGVLDVKNASPNLMCHSMGNYLLFEMMAGMQNPQQPFEQIFMIAADVAIPVFDKKSDLLASVAKETKVYVNKKDVVLYFSGLYNHVPRLGKKGTEVDRDFITILDCTKEKEKGFKGKFSRHLYYKSCPVIRESLKKQINY